jgi:hypothetical protein
MRMGELDSFNLEFSEFFGVKEHDALSTIGLNHYNAFSACDKKDGKSQTCVHDSRTVNWLVRLTSGTSLQMPGPISRRVIGFWPPRRPASHKWAAHSDTGQAKVQEIRRHDSLTHAARAAIARHDDYGPQPIGCWRRWWR